MGPMDVYGALASESVGMVMRGMEGEAGRVAAAAPASEGEGSVRGGRALRFQSMGAVCASSLWVEVSRGKVDAPRVVLREGAGMCGASAGARGACGAVRLDAASLAEGAAKGGAADEASQAQAQDGEGRPTRRLEVGWAVPGTFHVCSTAAGFAGCGGRAGEPGRAEVMRRGADAVWAAIVGGEALEDPGRLARYACLCFPEAGRGLVHYWFAFPALPMLPAATVGRSMSVEAWCAQCNGQPAPEPEPEAPKGVGWGAYSALSGSGISGYLRKTLTWTKKGLDCAALMRALGVAFQDHARGGACLAVIDFDAPARGADPSTPTSVVEVVGHSLVSPPDAATLPPRARVALLFADPSNYPGVPGWPLRNLLALLRVRFAPLLDAVDRKVMVVCCRGRGAIPDPKESQVLEEVWVPPLEDEEEKDGGSAEGEVPAYPGGDPARPSMQWAAPVGWDNDGKRNARLGPRTANLQSMAAEEGLGSVAEFVAEQASLHVRLMRHAALPGLDVARLRSTRVLVLGCGAAGCAALRTLVGWGLRRFVLVDYARVDATHPPRESLFAQSDVGEHKSHAAARALDRLCPDMRSQGVVLRVPLPGSNVGAFRPGEPDRGGVYKGLSLDAHEALTDAAVLRELVGESDVVLCLFGSARAMWLPSLVAAEAGKVMISVKVEFDAYSVVRHDPARGCGVCAEMDAGAEFGATAGKPREAKLENERCHLLRPGCAQAAGSLAAELLATSIHGAGEDEANAPGDVPHTLRGSVASWTLEADGAGMRPSIARPDCPACSTASVSEYRTDLARAYTVPAFGSAGERGWRAAVLSDDDDSAEEEDDDRYGSSSDSDSLRGPFMGRGSDMRSPGPLPPLGTLGGRHGMPQAVPVSRYLLEKFNARSGSVGNDVAGAHLAPREETEARVEHNEELGGGEPDEDEGETGENIGLGQRETFVDEDLAEPADLDAEDDEMQESRREEGDDDEAGAGGATPPDTPDADRSEVSNITAQGATKLDLDGLDLDDDDEET